MHWGTYSQWGIVESWSICPEDYGWYQRNNGSLDEITIQIPEKIQKNPPCKYAWVFKISG